MQTQSSILVLLLTLSLALPVLSLGTYKTDPNLHRVRNIYVAQQTSVETDAETSRRLDSAMKQALQTFGFTVVADQSTADAVMTGEIGWMITFDAPQPDPPKYGYHYRLTSSRYGVTWETEVEAGNRLKSEADRIGLNKVARNLFKDWKQSASKAGIVVRDKLP